MNKFNHNVYIVPGLVDGQRAHDEAQRRLVDPRHPETSMVHAHAEGKRCNNDCRAYLFPVE